MKEVIEKKLSATLERPTAARVGDGKKSGDGESTEGSVRFDSSRFGELEVPEDIVLRFPMGLVGLPQSRRFVLLTNPSGGPFQWLHSLDDPSLAFVVATPEHFFANYEVPVPEDTLAALKLNDVSDALLLVILNVPADPQEITANLQGPLVISPETRAGMQLVLQVPEYTTRHRIFPEMPAREDSPQECCSNAKTDAAVSGGN